MTEYVAMFAGGLLGSAHCVGMCGPFAAIVGAQRRSVRAAVSRQLCYNLGRVFTYVFLGATGGHAAGYLARVAPNLWFAQHALGVAAGVLMIAIGLTTLGFLRFRWIWFGRLLATAAPVFRHFVHRPAGPGIFLGGVANGFLPCGLVYAFLALAVTSGSALSGSLMMACFGLGTIPAMTAIGCGSNMLSPRARLRVYRFSAALVILAGAITIHRAWRPPADGCCDHATPRLAADITAPAEEVHEP
jgi:hypothetical protein